MKLLYFAPISDGTGYSHAAHDNIAAINAAGIEVLPVDIKLSNFTSDVPALIKKLMGGTASGATHTIQHILPYAFEWTSKYKNVGCFAYETDNMRPMGWHRYCNYMDGNTVFSEQNKQMCLDSGVKTPVSVIPQATDVDKYFKDYLPLVDGIKKTVGNRFVFLSVGDWSYRKNLANLVRAYLTEFSHKDDVALVLKTYVSGKNSDDSINYINSQIQGIKERIRKSGTNRFPPIYILCDRMSDDEISGLHQLADCYVSIELGSGWCIPAFEAMGFGKPVIANEWGGHTDFTTLSSINTHIPVDMEPCYGMEQTNAPYYELYSCHQKWGRPNFSKLLTAMRNHYNDRQYWSTDSKMSFLKKYSYETVGKQWRDVLESI